jgi:hypothetical protein
VHSAADVTPLTVKSTLPKLSPVTVTDIAAVSATFSLLYDTTGPSKLIKDSPVPATALTVSMACPEETDASDAAVMHCTLVLLDQLAVPHNPPGSSAV